jgi:hypothetical protein
MMDGRGGTERKRRKIRINKRNTKRQTRRQRGIQRGRKENPEDKKKRGRHREWRDRVDDTESRDRGCS